MASEVLKKLADELKTAREEKDISLQQIASKTKIDIKFLRAIESADFDIMPDIYMKAFIKEYAHYIDLDSKEIVKRFESAKLGKTEGEEVPAENSESLKETAIENQQAKKFDSTEHSSTTNPAEESTHAPRKLNQNYLYAGTIVVLVLILIYVAFIKGSSPDIVQEGYSQQPAGQDEPRYEMTSQDNKNSQSNSQQSTANQPDSLRLNIQVLGRSWVKVSSDGKLITQQVYQADSKLNFTASKNFSVTVGNAGLVKLWLNNKPIEKVGKQGEIRNLVITPDTIRYYTIIPPTKNEAKSAKKN